MITKNALWEGRASCLVSHQLFLKTKPQSNELSRFGAWVVLASHRLLSLLPAKSTSIFDILLWINAETEESLLQSFTDLAIGLHLEGASRGLGLSNHGLVQSWLLICGL